MLRLIQSDWLAAPKRPRHQILWAIGYLPAPEDGPIGWRTPPDRLWLLDRSGIRPGDPWVWARFYAVQIEQRWCGATTRASVGLPHASALVDVACFAPHPDGTSMYLEWSRDGYFTRSWKVVIGRDGAVDQVVMRWGPTHAHPGWRLNI
ncbi:MAG TPA: hypothetical protein VFS21_31840 [Roseiflexaceae bacterium]|nr:hypothetical protein [Roseiflexaceae bacterium]